MEPRVLQVQPLDNFLLYLTFSNQEKKIFDVKPYLNKDIFRTLNDLSVFNSVKVMNGTVVWMSDIDLCPDTLYLESRHL